MDVKIKTVELELRTVKLTKALLKQITEIHVEIRRDGTVWYAPSYGAQMVEVKVIGWVHGSVIGEDYQTWLIVDLGDGDYGRASVNQDHRKRFKQIYV